MKKEGQGIVGTQVLIHREMEQLSDLLSPEKRGMRIHALNFCQGDHLSHQSQSLEFPLKQSISPLLKKTT
jgi:hypothetical protein